MIDGGVQVSAGSPIVVRATGLMPRAVRPPMTGRTPSTAGDTVGSSWLNNQHEFLMVNHFARDTPWLHGLLVWFANGGVGVLAALMLVGWWVGRRSSLRMLAAVVAAGVAALVAVAVNQPIVAAVREPRPFQTLPHILVLLHHSADPGFPSDHAALAGAIAVGLCFATWRLGVPAVLTAVLLAFSRVYVGVHYPRDVAAGLLLGAALAALVELLVAPSLLRALQALARTRVRPLLRSGRTGGAVVSGTPPRGSHSL